MKTVDQIVDELGLEVGEIAARSGLTPSRVEAIISGRWLSSPSERKAIATALDVSMEEVIWGHTMSPRVVRYHQFGLKEDIHRGTDDEA